MQISKKIKFLCISLLFPVACTANDGEINLLESKDCARKHELLAKKFSDLNTKKYDKESYKELGGLVIISMENCRGDTNHLTLLSNVYTALGENKKALQLAKEALDSNPEDAFANEKYGSMLLLIHDKSGIQYYDKAIKLAPENYAIKLNYCTGLENVKEYKKAVEICSDLIESEKYKGYGYFVRSRAYKSLGELEKAESDLNHAKELGVDLSKYYTDEHYSK